MGGSFSDKLTDSAYKLQEHSRGQLSDPTGDSETPMPGEKGGCWHLGPVQFGNENQKKKKKSGTGSQADGWSRTSSTQ